MATNTEKAKKAKKAKAAPEAAKPAIPNFEKCCSCKYFRNHPGFCKRSNQYTARKATCGSYNAR